MGSLRPTWVVVLALGWASATPWMPARIVWAGEGASHFAWRYVALRRGVGSEGLRAVAADPLRERFAVGGRDGVSFYVPGGEVGLRLSQVGDVADLAFDAHGQLWIASDGGLFSHREGEGVQRHVLFAGAAANRVRRVVAVAGALLAATEGGVFVRRRDERWQRLAAVLPLGPAHALAARPVSVDARGHAKDLEVWVVVAGQLWRVDLPSRESGVLIRARARRVRSIEGVAVAELPVQIVLDAPGYDVVLVYPRALAMRQSREDRFAVVRPAAAPGAAFTWLAVDAGRFWLATKAGLWWARADARGRPFWRAAPPAGAHPVRRVLAQGARVLAASAVGLLEARIAFPGGDEAARVTGACRASCDPDIRSVQRATLRYVGLEPQRFRALRRAVAVRGWWPTLHLRFGAFVGRERGIDHDQSFSYGEMHHLYDRDGSRERNLDAAVELRWDFGNAAYDPLAVDLSRESRQRIALRDDVLDQVNQLYFERQAVLERLREVDPLSAEGRKLALRAEELAAGLDGWTGGWFRPVQEQALRPP